MNLESFLSNFRGSCQTEPSPLSLVAVTAAGAALAAAVAVGAFAVASLAVVSRNGAVGAWDVG